MLTSQDPQVVIRTARQEWSCACYLRRHNHGPATAYGGALCQNVIRKGDRYPEYFGETPAYQSGHRFCSECRADQLGEMISDVR